MLNKFYSVKVKVKNVCLSIGDSTKVEGLLPGSQ
jgi:hypothetical protein